MTEGPSSNKSKVEVGKVDPLLDSLVFITAHFGRAKSGPALTAGLAYGEKNMGPALFCEAADRIGLKTRIVARDKIRKIPVQVLPAVLILKHDQACVLLKISNDGKAARIWSPDSAAERDVRIDDLKKDYGGYAIFIHPRPEFNDDKALHLEDADRHWFWGPMGDAKPMYRKVVVAAILINLFGLTSPIFIMNVYDRVIPNAAMETGWVLGIGALCIFGFDFLMRTLRGYFIDLAGRRTDVIASRRIYDQVLNMKLSKRPASSGAFANMLRDFDSVRDFYTSATLATLVDLPFTALFLVVIWMIGGPIALILMILIAMVFATGMVMQIPLKNMVRKAAKSAEAKHGLLVETIHGLETIKSIGADGRMRARYGQYVAENAGYAQHSRFFSAMGVNIATFFQQIAVILVVLAGMYLVRDSAMTVGGLIACVMLSGRAIAPIGQLANLMSRYHTAKGALKTLNGVMANPVERPPHTQFLHRPSLKGKIEFRGVSFAYPGTDRKVLDDVSFTIQAGEKVGVIGRIGSGKSTIARLAMGLYDSSGGAIFYDDTDSRQIDPADLRRNTAYIAQDVVLFSGTVRDNMTASVPHAGEAEILAASKASGVHDFVSLHPMGYDAPVGEGGLALSGGQRQCVALARAMLLGPSLYVCDEPTNAMDVQSENTFTRHVQQQSDGKTLILITHRQHLLSLVSRLILIEQGRVVMDGPRDKVIEALSNGGIEVKGR